MKSKIISTLICLLLLPSIASASWAYMFVVRDGYVYVISDESVEEVGKRNYNEKTFFGSNKVYAVNKKRKNMRRVYIAGSVFNIAIGEVVGGAVSAVKGYIKKKGKKEVTQTLSRVATAQKPKMKLVRKVAIATVIEVLSVRFRLC